MSDQPSVNKKTIIVFFLVKMPLSGTQRAYLNNINYKFSIYMILKISNYEGCQKF